MIEDGTSQLKNSINKKVARQILKNLLKTEIQGCSELLEAQTGVMKFLKACGDAIRPSLKLSGGYE